MDRKSPQSLEAEMALLGSIMLDEEAYYKINISSQMFYKTAHQKIFFIIQELASKENASFDMIAVSEELKNKGWLDEIGGAYYLTELCEAIPSSAQIEYHANIVKQKYYSRKLIEGLHLIQKQVYTTDPLEIVEEISKLSMIAVEENKNEVFETWKVARLKTYTELENPEKQKRIKTIPCMHDLQSSFSGGELITISGHSSHGKTAFMLQTILENAEKKWALIFSMEMTKTEIMGRLLCQKAKVNTIHFREQTLTPGENDKLRNNEQELNIRIDETPYITWQYIEWMCRRMKMRCGLDVIGIDYLQLMKLADGETQELKISNTMKQLKRIAKNFGITSLLLSQLAKDQDGRRCTPSLGRLKYSSAIEQDSDIVLFTYLPNPEDKTEAKIISAKNRNGITGEKDVYFAKEYTLFKNKF